MGSSQRKALIEPQLAMYHHMVMDTGVLDPDEATTSLTTLAETYADEVIASLPEEDLEVLRKGLTGAFLSFLVDAALILTST
jgi:hypothetical protein